MHRAHYAFISLRAGDGQHVRMALTDDVGFCAKAAGYDDLAVLVESKANGIQRFIACGIKKAAGIDDHQIGTVMLAGDFVAFGAKAGDDAFGIDKRLRAAKRNKTDARCAHWENLAKYRKLRAQYHDKGATVKLR